MNYPSLVQITACCLVGARSLYLYQCWNVVNWTLGPNFSEILIEIKTHSFKKKHLKMSPGKWRSFCLDINVLAFFLKLTFLRLICPMYVHCTLVFKFIVRQWLMTEIRPSLLIWTEVLFLSVRFWYSVLERAMMCRYIPGSMIRIVLRRLSILWTFIYLTRCICIFEHLACFRVALLWSCRKSVGAYWSLLNISPTSKIDLRYLKYNLFQLLFLIFYD